MDFAKEPSCADTIATLNDTLRREGRGGRIVVTIGVHSLPAYDDSALILALGSYDQFDSGNDPYRERDFGAFQLFGAQLCWKIDYYDCNLQFGSDDPSDPKVTVRVLTVMLNSEY